MPPVCDEKSGKRENAECRHPSARDALDETNRYSKHCEDHERNLCPQIRRLDAGRKRIDIVVQIPADADEIAELSALVYLPLRRRVSGNEASDFPRPKICEEADIVNDCQSDNDAEDRCRTPSHAGSSAYQEREQCAKKHELNLRAGDRKEQPGNYRRDQWMFPTASPAAVIRKIRH